MFGFHPVPVVRCRFSQSCCYRLSSFTVWFSFLDQSITHLFSDRKITELITETHIEWLGAIRIDGRKPRTPERSTRAMDSR
jgi:hypothetical protein